ncbi:unnamed protein product [Ixodes pacificus]
MLSFFFFFVQASGNKVSRNSVLCGSHNIVLNGKTIIQSKSIIRGDLANVRIGRHCVISSSSVIRPPFKKFSKGVAFFPLQIGDHVFIDEGSVVNAAHVGSFVFIGKNCVIVSRGSGREGELVYKINAKMKVDRNRMWRTFFRSIFVRVFVLFWPVFVLAFISSLLTCTQCTNEPTPPVYRELSSTVDLLIQTPGSHEFCLNYQKHL